MPDTGPAALSDEAPEGRGLLIAYLFALALYVALGLLVKSLVLNWIVGPLFPLIVLYLVPRAWARVSGGGSR